MCLAGIFLVAVAEDLEGDFAAAQEVKGARKLQVAHVFEMGHGVEAIGSPRMTGDEHEVAFLGACLAPFEVIVELGRLVVLVDAEDANVEVVARILEIVWVAAEESDIHFGGEDQSDVGVFAECVEVVLTALVESDDLGAPLLVVLAVKGVFLQFVHDGAAGEGGFFGAHIGRHFLVDFVGDVLDVDEDIQLGMLGLDLVGASLGVEAGFDIIVRLVTELLEDIEADVVVGNDQAIGGDERAGSAAIEAHGGFLQMVVPGLWLVELVTLLENLGWRVLIQVHAFVGPDGAGDGE